MKVIKRIWLPDVVITIFPLSLLFIIVWGWRESERSFFEGIVAILLGLLIGKIGIRLDRYMNKKHHEDRLSTDKPIPFIRIAIILFMIAGFMTNLVPIYAKYWIYSFMVGFIGKLAYALIRNEFSERKRYEWSDLKK